MIRLVAVVVPACNEQSTVAECLASIRTAIGTLPATVAVRVVVVLDRCTDATEVVVRKFAEAEIVHCEAGNVGSARALGAAAVLATCGLPWDEVWIANTDADSLVPADWLVSMVSAADDGAEVVLGTVLPGAGLRPEVELAWHAAHPVRLDHPHVHGANLGIRGDAYLELGGWEQISTGEDVALARCAAGRGLRILKTAAIPVTTSARLVGRAPFGFANYLADLSVAAG